MTGLRLLRKISFGSHCSRSNSRNVGSGAKSEAISSSASSESSTRSFTEDMPSLDTAESIDSYETDDYSVSRYTGDNDDTIADREDELPVGWDLRYDPVLSEFYYVNEKLNEIQFDSPLEVVRH